MNDWSKKIFSLMLGALLVAQIFVLAPFADSASGVPKIISYQGRLANSSGSLLGDSGTTFYFRFGIYNASSGGTRLWPSGGGDPCTHALTVREGVFNAGIGDTSECSDILDYNFHDNDNIYLQVEVSSTGISGWEALSPRQRIGASGFAINSQTISGSTGGTPNVLGNLVTAYSFQGGASATSGTVFLLDTPTSFVGNFINVQYASTTRFILDQGGRAAFGTSTFSGLSVLTVGATTTTSIPLSLKGVSGQSANLFQILDSADTQLLTVDNTGQLGVGSSTPRALFSVGGNILVGGTGGVSPALSGTSTIVSNLDVYGNFRVNGVCISGCTSVGLSGGGTTNFIAKFTGAATVGDSSIFDSGGFVGIATTTSSARFSVYGSTTIQTFQNVPTAFRILNAATTSVFTVDTVANRVTFDYGSTTALSAGAGTITNASSTYLSTLQNLNVGNDLIVTGDASSTYFSTSQNLSVGNSLITGASSTFGGVINVSSGTSSFNGGIRMLGHIDVAGANATSTFANGITLANGCFAINGTCIGGGGGSVTGAGTQNFVAKYTTTGSIIGNSSIFDDGLFVGIGTSTPLTTASRTLAIYGSTTIQTFQNVPTAFRILNAATSSVFTVDTVSNRVTFDYGSTTALSAGAGTITNASSTYLSSLQNLSVGNDLIITGDASSTYFSTSQNANIGNDLIITGDASSTYLSTSQNLTVGNSLITGASSTFGGVINVSSGTSTFNGGIRTLGHIDVAGANATSTFANGITLANGCFAINGACVGGGSGGVTGAGTQNFVAKYTTTGSTIGNSSIFDDGLFTGIGTSTPLTTAGRSLAIYGSTTIQTFQNVPTAFRILNSATTSVFTVDTVSNRVTFDYGSTTALSATAGTITNASSTYLSTLQNLSVGNDLFVTGDASSTYFSTSQNANIGNDLIITGDASSTYLSTSQNLTVGNSLITAASSTFGGVINVSSGTSTFNGGIFTLGNLNVAGANATSTFANGITLANGCFAINGTCIGGGSGGVTGAGTQNFVAKYTTTGSTIGNSSIFDDGLFVGIGTSTPLTTASRTLAIYGSTTIQTFQNVPTAFRILNAATSSVFTVDTVSNRVTFDYGSTTALSAGAGTITNASTTYLSTLQNLSVGNDLIVTGDASTTYFSTSQNANIGNDLIITGDASSTYLSTSQNLNVGNSLITGASSTFGGVINVSSGTSTFNGGIFTLGNLNVAGSGATSTFANGITLANGCFAINGTCVGGGSGGVTGAGTQNFVAKYTTTGSTIGNSSIFDDGLFTGIGTSTPLTTASRSLAIYGSTTIQTFQNVPTAFRILNSATTSVFTVDTISNRVTFDYGSTTALSATAGTITNASSTYLSTLQNLSVGNDLIVTGDASTTYFSTSQNANIGNDLIITGDASSTYLSTSQNLNVGNSLITGASSTFGGVINVSSGTSTFNGGIRTLGHIDVAGANATSTFANGITLANGCFAINGTCIGGGSGGVTGAGTENFVAKYTTTGSTIGNSSIFDDGLFTGIGTSTPLTTASRSLAIYGSTTIQTFQNVPTAFRILNSATSSVFTVDTISNRVSFDYGSTTALTASNLFSTNASSTYLSTIQNLNVGNDLFITGDASSTYFSTSQNANIGNDILITGDASSTYLSTSQNLNVGNSLITGASSTFGGVINVSSGTSTFNGGIRTLGHIDVAGANATSTFANGITLANGCYAVGGACIISNTANLSGSGTQNFITKWTGGTALGNSSIFDDGLFTGIGTSTPLTTASRSLAIYGSTTIQTFQNVPTAFRILNAATSSVFTVDTVSNRVTFDYGSTTALSATSGTITNASSTYLSTLQNLSVGGDLIITGDASSTYLSTSQNLTVGNSLDTRGSSTINTALNVGGTILSDGTITSRSGTSSLANLDLSGNFEVRGSATTTFNQAVAHGSGDLIVARGGTGNLLLNPYGGSVGIGSSTPATTLGVTGDLYLTGGLGVGVANTSAGTARINSTLHLLSNTSCAGGQALQTNFAGLVSCGTVTSGGSSTGGGWTSTDASQSINLATTSYKVLIGQPNAGASSSPYAKFTISSENAATTTMVLSPAIGQVANIIDIYNVSGGISSVLTASGNFGLGALPATNKLFVYGSTTIQTWQNVPTAFQILNAATSSVFTVDTVSGSTTIAGVLNVGNGTSTFNGGIRMLGHIDVAGANATSTFANGITLANGCFAINGTCIGGGSGGVTGAGTENFVAKYTTTGSTIGNSSIFDDGLFTGIGTSTPLTTASRSLAIYGSTTIQTFQNVPTAFRILNSATSSVFTVDTISNRVTFDYGSTTALSAGAGTITNASSTYLSTLQNLSVGNDLIITGDASSTYFSTSQNLNVGNDLIITGDASSTYLSTSQNLNVGNSLITGASSTFGGVINVSSGTSTFNGGIFTLGNLNVAGSGATSTFANGITLANGCYAVGGTCIISNTANLSGSGTQNFITKWTGGTALGNSSIFDDGLFVGIGTSTPLTTASRSLAIYGSTTIQTFQNVPTAFRILNSATTSVFTVDTISNRVSFDYGSTTALSATSGTITNASSTYLSTLQNLSVGNDLIITGDASSTYFSTSQNANIGNDLLITGDASSTYLSTSQNLNVGNSLITGASSTFGGVINVSSGTSTFNGGIFTLGNLNVAGSGATSTFANGITLANGCFAINGTCIGGGGGSVTGAGTENFVAKYTTTGSTIGNSSIFDDGLFTGIGTSTPLTTASRSLAIYGSTTIQTFQNVPTAFRILNSATSSVFTVDTISNRVTFDYGSTTALSATAGTITNASSTYLSTLQNLNVGNDLIITGDASSTYFSTSQNLNVGNDLLITGDASSTYLSTSQNLSVGNSLITGASSTFGGVINVSSGTSTFNGGIRTLGHLDVAGVNATSTFANGITLANGCFAINGTCIGGGSGGVTGAGTENFVAKYTTTGSTIGNSSIFDDGLFVGIGTSTPLTTASRSLAIYGSTTIQTFQNVPTAFRILNAATSSVFTVDTISNRVTFDYGSTTALSATSGTITNASSTYLSTLQNLNVGNDLIITGDASSTYFSTSQNLNVGNDLLITGDASSTYLSTSQNLNVGNSLITAASSTFGGVINVSSGTSTFNGGIFTLGNLNVAGSGATSTFANGITLANGCYAVGGTCIISNTANLSGSGTQNFITKWTGGTALGNSSIFDDGLFTGIGTSTPLTTASRSLAIYGSTTIQTFQNVPTAFRILNAATSSVFTVDTVSNRVTFDYGSTTALSATAGTITNASSTYLSTIQNLSVGNDLFITGDASSTYFSTSQNLNVGNDLIITGDASTTYFSTSQNANIGNDLIITGDASSTYLSTSQNLNVGNSLITAASSTFGGVINVSSGTSTFNGGIFTLGNLNVAGANATSTFANGITLANGCFAINGTCVGGGSGGVTGAGTENFVAKYTTTGSTIGNSSIFDDGLFVGIGTSTPLTTASRSLAIYGSTTIQTFQNVPTAFRILNSATTSVFTVDTISNRVTFDYGSTTALTASNLFSTNASSTYLSTLQNLSVGNDLFITGDASSTYFSTSQNANIGNDLIITGDASSTYFSTSQNLSVGNSLITGASSTFGGVINVSSGTSSFNGGIRMLGHIDVAGANATSTFANGITLANGCFAINGTCIGGGGGSVTGAGTQNFVAKYTTTGSTIGNSSIFDDGLFVGIGTSTPLTTASRSLAIYGSTTIQTFQNVPTAFRILNAATSSVFTVDTISNRVTFDYGSTTALSAGAGTITNASSTYLSTSQNLNVGNSLITAASSTFGGVINVSSGTSTFNGGIRMLGHIDVAGANATSTFANGITLANGCFAINGTCIGGGSGGVTGAGTENFVAKYTTTGSTIGNSSIFDDGLFTGIGTSTPLTTAGRSLAIYGSTTIQTFQNVPTAFRILNAATSTAFVVDTVNTRVGIGTSTPFGALSVNHAGGEVGFVVGSSSATSFIVDKNGNVGIGTTGPNFPLEVNGTIAAVNGITGVLQLGNTSDNQNATLSFSAASDNNLDIKTNYSGGTTNRISFFPGGTERVRFLQSGNVGIGTTSPWGLLSVNPNGITGPAFVVGSSTLTNFIVTNSGGTNGLSRVGIGTSSPIATLSILASTTPALRIQAEGSSTPAFIVGSMAQNGNVAIGTTTSLAKLTIDGTTNDSGAATAIAGIYGFYTTLGGGGGTQVGNRFVLDEANTVANTGINTLIRVRDNTALSNTTRGIEVIADAGSNTSGTSVNTGIRTRGYTFGIQAITTGAGAGSLVPAAIYGEIDGTTGEALRLYSDSITNANFAHLFQEDSAFTGIGLKMDFGRDIGTFTGDFLSLELNDNPRFVVTYAGTTTIGQLGQTTIGGGLQVVLGAICADNDGTGCLTGASAPADGRLVSINATVLTDDLAELMRSSEELEPGDIVAPDPDFVNTNPRTYEQERRSSEWGTTLGLDEIGVKKTTRAYDAATIGVVSTKPGITLGGFEKTKNDFEIALAGRVPVKVSTESGPIKVGDRITSSSIAGIGMKADTAGITVGIALEAFDGEGLYPTGPTNLETELVCTEKVIAANNTAKFGGGADAESGEGQPASSGASWPTETTEEVCERVVVQKSVDMGPAETRATPDGAGVKVAKILVLVNLGYGNLNVNGAMASGDTTNPLTNAWAVDQQSGKVNVSFFGDINMQGNSILDVGRIAGMFGKWSIDENGNITAQKVTTQELEVGTQAKPSGITIYDSETGEPYCIGVAHGALRSIAGVCAGAGSPASGSQIPASSSGGEPATGEVSPPAGGETLNNTDSPPPAEEPVVTEEPAPEPLPVAEPTPAEEPTQENISTTTPEI